MTHAHSRPTSSKFWFRKDVPKDIRDLAGTTSWQKSLETADPELAVARRAFYSAHYEAEVIRLRAIKKQQVAQDAERLIDRAFNRLAAHFQSLDVAVSSELTKIATIVRSSWGIDHARSAEKHHFGKAHTKFFDPEGEAVPAIDSDEGRQRLRLRAELLEGRSALTDGSSTDGAAYQELAAALLARGSLQQIHFAIGYLPYLVPEIDLSTKATYEAIATAYLARLANYRFASWPQGVEDILPRPIAIPAALPLVIPPPPVPGFSGHTLEEAFSRWKQNKRITSRNKTADEFETVLRRFHELCGTTDVTLITRDMVETFIAMAASIPVRPKKEVSDLPLVQQIAVAVAKNLPTLAPPTVGKHLVAIRRMLAVAKTAKWVEHNAAADVSVEGSKWEGDELDHFSDADMKLIYGSPLMTDPDACSDTMFWILFMAPFHGSRPGEHCKLKPEEVVEEEGEWIMRFRRDKRVKNATAASTTTTRRQKTRQSVRDVPLHWIVLEGGFLEMVDHQRRQGAEWLFDDLRVDNYGDRYRLLSNEINRALRKLGMNEVDKAFYSTRHTMKREGRRRRIAKQSLDQIAGHASGDAGDRYGQGVPIDILEEDIDRLEFRSVDWDPVVACAQERLRRRSGEFILLSSKSRRPKYWDDDG